MTKRSWARGRPRHGESMGARTPEYRCWLGMIRRCESPKCKSYKYYGGRGITICKRWRDSYEAFLADMGRKPSPELTLEREDNERGYELGNCVWAPRSAQIKNRRFLGKKVTAVKLTEDQIRKIRSDARSPQSIIAADFSITQSLVSMIKNRKVWANVSD